MSYMRHHGIIVSGQYEDWAETAMSKAIELFGADQVSGMVLSKANHVHTFMVGPDGGKEDSPESAAGDIDRASFIHWLSEQKYEDGCRPLQWVEVQYADDEGKSMVVAHSERGHSGKKMTKQDWQTIVSKNLQRID